MPNAESIIVKIKLEFDFAIREEEYKKKLQEKRKLFLLIELYNVHKSIKPNTSVSIKHYWNFYFFLEFQLSALSIIDIQTVDNIGPHVENIPFHLPFTHDSGQCSKTSLLQTENILKYFFLADSCLKSSFVGCFVIFHSLWCHFFFGSNRFKLCKSFAFYCQVQMKCPNIHFSELATLN